MKTRYIIIGAAAIVLVLLLFGIYYVISLKSIRITGGGVTSVNNITAGGAVIEGYVEVYNPSYINIRFESADLTIKSKANNLTLGSGTIKGMVIEAKKSTRIQFRQELKSEKLMAAAGDVLRTGRFVVSAEGHVHVSRFFNISVPFSFEYDVGGYFRDVAARKINEIAGAIADLFS